MSILIFLAILFVLVLVHEFGHFIVAKLSGMRVDEFGIGFPPKLFGIKRGETEYTFNLFPIGGFVKIFGEDGEGAPSARLAEDFSEQSERKSPASGQHQYDEDGDENTSATEKSDSGRSFSAQNKWKQSAVLVAGVTMNVLLGWVLFSAAYMNGVTQIVDESTATPSAALMITEVRPETPAALASLPQGAKIVSLSAKEDTLSTLTPSAFSEFVNAHASEEVVISYTVGSELRLTSLIPEKGIIASDPDRAAIGIALALTDVVKLPFVKAVTEGFTHTVSSLAAIAVGISDLIVDAVTMKADFSQVAGPIGIVGLVGDASAFGISALLMFTAFISLNLAIINILPFPALDGGRLVFVIVEAVKGSPIRPQYAQVLNTIGFALLIILMVAVTWNDIARII